MKAMLTMKKLDIRALKAGLRQFLTGIRQRPKVTNLIDSSLDRFRSTTLQNFSRGDSHEQVPRNRFPAGMKT